MKRLSLLGLALILPVSLHARTWVVDNDTSRPADFRSAQAAHDAAEAGDTLLFVGSTIDYDGFEVRKSLHIIGPGYGVGLLPSANPIDARLGTIDFLSASSQTPGAGSSGSILQGLNAVTVRAPGDVNNIVIDKCYIPGGVEAGRQRLNNDDPFSVSGILISRSYTGTISIFGSQVSIHNSYVGSFRCAAAVSNDYWSTLTMNRCVIGNHSTAGDSCVGSNDARIINSIIISGHGFTRPELMPGLHLINSIMYQEGEAASEWLPESRVFRDYNEVFHQGFISPTDTTFILADSASNPAKGIADDGGDIGMFSGSRPYVLSPTPALPRVTHLNTSGVASDTVGLTLTVGGEIRD